jgi:hypothetical protein
MHCAGAEVDKVSLTVLPVRREEPPQARINTGPSLPRRRRTQGAALASRRGP